MSNEEFVKSAMPECIAEYSSNIDWSRYIPSGGWEFQKAFRERRLPLIEEDIANAKAAISAAASKKSVLAAFKAAAETFHKSAVEFHDAWGHDILRCFAGDGSNLCENIITTADEVLESDDFPTAEVEGDIAYLEAFRDFFKKDLELDMTLWAIEYVPVKFRTKVFRTAYKTMQEVLRLREMMDGVKGGCCSEVLRTQFAKPLEEFSKCYAALPKFLRMEMKAVKEQGEAYWRGRDPVESQKMRSEASARAGSWNVAF